jgi:hypothetical protein
MKVTFDFSEFDKFADRLVSTHELNTALMTATKKIAQVLHQHLLKYTPVDTGNLRKMWSAGDNLAFTVESVTNGFQVTLINEARRDSKDGFMYGLAVNDGHKTPGGNGWVIGRFFVEKSVVASETQVEHLIYNELQKWWNWCING